MEKPVLITITAPSCGGKSFLFNYIRDVAKLPCLVSTTTRPARKGEQEGVDYYYISQAESVRLENEGKFAELAVYNGQRYGVTTEEFEKKISTGMAFLICEPTGIEHYAKPARDIGGIHYKTYVHTDPEVRFDRFFKRTMEDIEMVWATGVSATQRIASMALHRFHAMMTEEMKWGEIVQYDRKLMGTDTPAYNLEIILRDIDKLRADELDANEFQERLKTSEQNHMEMIRNWNSRQDFKP